MSKNSIPYPIAAIAALTSTGLFAMDLKPSMGIDLLAAKVRYEKDYGQNLYDHSPTGIGINLSLQFTDLLGMTIGTERYRNRSNNIALLAGEKTPGATAALLAGQHFKLTTKQSYYTSYMRFNVNYNIDAKHRLTFGLGPAYAIMKNQFHIYENQVGSVSTYRSFEKKSMILDIAAGYHYSIDSEWAVKTTVNYKNTSQLKSKSKEVPSAASEVRMKDTYSATLGLVYSF